MSDWPHAPAHRFGEAGAYMVTAGTYGKAPLLNSERKLDLVQDRLFEVTLELNWELRAWAILRNHYHFMATQVEDASSLGRMISKLHTLTARELNVLDGCPGRRVWFQFWDSHITHERSYLARLNYVHNNPLKHGVAGPATRYKWCSAAWFERNASSAFQKTVASFKTDRLKVRDDY